MSYDTANCARVYQHDVRAKQTKICDAERTVFPPVDKFQILSYSGRFSK